MSPSPNTPYSVPKKLQVLYGAIYFIKKSLSVVFRQPTRMIISDILNSMLFYPMKIFADYFDLRDLKIAIGIKINPKQNPTAILLQNNPIHVPTRILFA